MYSHFLNNYIEISHIPYINQDKLNFQEIIIKMFLPKIQMANKVYQIMGVSNLSMTKIRMKM